jgi:hypothetical protein
MWALIGPDGVRIIMPHGRALAAGYRLAMNGAPLPSDQELAKLWGRRTSQRASWFKAGFQLGQADRLGKFSPAIRQCMCPLGRWWRAGCTCGDADRAQERNYG